MIYNIVNHKRRHNNDELFKLFEYQIDNSLYYGWNKNDIIIGANFDFEYKGIKSYPLTDICEFNIFNNKWYGLLELMNQGILDDDIWFHDQDNWQIDHFNFPLFSGEIAAATYVKTSEWNTGSVFIKKTALNVLEYIVESMKLNPIEYQGDENWIAFLRANTEISNYLSTINTQYCVGYTHLDDRIKAANKPIKVLGYMPHSKAYKTFLDKNLVPLHLQNLYTIHENY